MHVELSDAELVRQIGSGSNRDAEAELYHRMAPRVRLYGLRHLRDEHASEDLTQQVLITTLEALRVGRLREPEKLASFVLGTCRMTVLNLRRSAHRKERLLAHGDFFLVNDQGNPGVGCFYPDTRDRIFANHVSYLTKNGKSVS